MVVKYYAYDEDTDEKESPLEQLSENDDADVILAPE